MGMDVIGKNPTGYIDGDESDAKSGHYFRANVWWWHPLWNYIEESFPHIACKVEYAHSNDGDGLGARDSKRLAKCLRVALANGHTDDYIEKRNAEISALPDEICEPCKGTGVRNDKFAREGGYAGCACNVCEGKGKRRPWACSYHMDRDIVEEFALFLENCGGFMIC